MGKISGKALICILIIENEILSPTSPTLLTLWDTYHKQNSTHNNP